MKRKPFSGAIRLAVYERDNGQCDVCTRHVRFEDFECGHIVDRVCGGSDDLDNLVVMCFLCNHVIKELHETREEYDQWKATDPFDRFIQGAVRYIQARDGAIRETDESF